MGRKIPGAKHRTIKYPDQQRATKWNELKDIVDAPPSNVDEQLIPKSLERVIQLKNDVKSGKIGGKKRKNKKIKSNLITLGSQNNIKLDPNSKPDKAVPVFNQRPDETTRVFWNRVNKETHHFINETKFEDKFGVLIKRNNETGEIEGVEKPPKDEIDELLKLKKKHANIGKKKKKKNILEPKLTKSQKKKVRLNSKKEKKLQDNIDEFKNYKDDIKFGEIAHAPPDIKVRPKKTENMTTKPSKKGLLLHSMLDKKIEADKSHAVKTNVTIDKTGKRKNLPSAERRILEKQQSDIIAAYKQIKSQRSSMT
ncbi:hypothetical protein HCN44_002537 [Aphidius gifuensis]|uniref:Uncharacterized protein n=1 Tax=Aphidius gifuensis TaxID=684658 RepID=A0A834Y2M4_APHGI|nr:coiled-coil domain-containing protein 137 [Aphidius gifuensis]KAF7996891.1 hypothetical protein HCN44_002537 [Aphidius gifuensis]